MSANRDLLTSVYPDERLHEQFKRVRDSPLHEPARAMLREVFADFQDVDGNFIEQFQTTGFDQRTFELYLYAVFREAGFAVDRTHARPDFLLTKDGTTVCIEAVTANPPTHVPYVLMPQDRTTEEHTAYLRHEVPVRFGSPLYSKLSKRYWELPHVIGKPLIVAIQNFHDAGSLLIGYATLSQYLFGLTFDWHHDEEGKLLISEREIDAHRVGSKEIPSGFFSLPDAQRISAVLFSNSGTISKFSRMGHQGRYRSKRVRILRFGARYRHNPNAAAAAPFLYEVDVHEDPETWREGTVLIHNPNALHPVPGEFIGAGAEDRLVNGRVVSAFMEPFLPYWSVSKLYPGDIAVEMLQKEVDAIAEELLGIYPPVEATE